MSNNRRQQDEQNRQREQVIARAVRNRDRTRQRLLAQGRKLARRRAKNIEQSQKRTDESDSSTIVSSHSTTPPLDSNARAAARHSNSTVPTQPKGSTVPAAPRLYGLGLHERLQSESVDETSVESVDETSVESVDETSVESVDETPAAENGPETTSPPDSSDVAADGGETQ